MIHKPTEETYGTAVWTIEDAEAHPLSSRYRRFAGLLAFNSASAINDLGCDGAKRILSELFCEY
jgi:hypothetical protein